MKKALALLLASVMVASMAACGSNTNETTGAADADTAATESVQDTAAESEAEGDSDQLIMVTEAGFAPYEYTEDGQTVIGVDVDIAEAIAEALGKELVIQNVTFDGALLAVQQGKADFAAAGITVTDERKEVMDFSITYATSKQVVVVKKDAGRVESVDALSADTVIGVQTGTVADFYCQDEGFTENYKQYNKFLEAAMDLKNDKIDCIIMDLLPAEEMVAANSDLMILDGEVLTDEYAIAVQKGNTEMLEQINEVLEQLIADGKIEEFTINHTTK